MPLTDDESGGLAAVLTYHYSSRAGLLLDNNSSSLVLSTSQKYFRSLPLPDDKIEAGCVLNATTQQSELNGMCMFLQTVLLRCPFFGRHRFLMMKSRLAAVLNPTTTVVE